MLNDRYWVSWGRQWLLLVSLGALLSGSYWSLHCQAAPPYQIKQTPPLRYVQQSTWFDSMLASQAALQEDEQAGLRPQGRVAFHSEVVRGREPARVISVPLHGVDEIYLYVTGAPDVEYGAADWIAPRVVDQHGNETLLCSDKFIDLQEGFHTVDCSLRSRVDPPLRVADEQFPHGINIQAPGKIRIRLPAGAVRFEAKIGIDDWVNPASYRLPQPYFYQPHHYSEQALRRSDATEGSQPTSAPKGAVRFHVTDAAGATRLDLWNQLACDFSHAAAHTQMKWERQDRIWEERWQPGNWLTLATRYVDACHRVPGLQDEAGRLAQQVTSRETLDRLRAIYHHSRKVDEAVALARVPAGQCA